MQKKPKTLLNLNIPLRTQKIINDELLTPPIANFLLEVLSSPQKKNTGFTPISILYFLYTQWADLRDVDTSMYPITRHTFSRLLSTPSLLIPHGIAPISVHKLSAKQIRCASVDLLPTPRHLQSPPETFIVNTKSGYPIFYPTIPFTYELPLKSTPLYETAVRESQIIRRYLEKQTRLNSIRQIKETAVPHIDETPNLG